MTATSASPGALLCLLAVVPSVLAFAPSSAGSATTAPHFHRHIPNTCPSRPPPPTAKKTSTSTTALGYAASPLPLTNDPYVLLGLSTREGSRLSGSGSAPYDEKEVKRAFRRMTKLYHPDAVTTKDSTEDERRRANDEFARINAAYQAILDPEAEEAPKTVQVQKPWYESVSDFKVNGGGTMGGTKVGDIFERNAQKREGVRNNPYSGMGGESSTSRGTARPNASNDRTSNPFGGFTSSAANSMSDIFDRNAQRRDKHRRAGTGPYDPNQSALEEKLASLMKQAAEADERYNNLKRETMNADSSLKEQNVALRRDAAGFKARCQSLEEQLKTAQVKAAAAAKASSSAAAANRNTNNSLSSKEKAVLGEKIAALRKEAADAQAKCSAMEEQVAVAKARCESLEAALKKSKSELEEKKKRRWGFGSGNGSNDDVPSDAGEEKEALQAKVNELETSVRNHVKVVQKYKKECDALKEKAARGSDVNGADRSTGDASPLSRERSSLRQAFRMRVSGTAAKTADLVKEPSLQILNKLNRSRKNLTTKDAPTLDPPASSSTTIPTHGKRIPTGARAKARMMPNHKYTSKKSSEFASAVGIASGAVQERSPEEEASVSSAPVSGAIAFRRVSDRMHEKKILVISGSVAVLVVRSLLKVWIKGGML